MTIRVRTDKVYLIDEPDLKKQNKILLKYLNDGAIGFIYETINTYNGKKYLGRKNFLNPKNKNNGWTNYYGSGVFIKKIIKNKEYKKSLVRKILYIGYTEEDLVKKEQFYLDKFDCANNPKYYNINKNAYGGYSRAGYTNEALLEWSSKIKEINYNYYLKNSKEIKERVANSNRNRKDIMNEEVWNSYLQKMKRINGGANNFWSMKTKIFYDNNLIKEFGCLRDAFNYMVDSNILKSYTTFHKMRKGYIYKGYKLEVNEKNIISKGNSVILYNDDETIEFKYYKQAYSFLKNRGYIKSYTSFTRDRDNNNPIMGFNILKKTSN